MSKKHFKFPPFVIALFWAAGSLLIVLVTLSWEKSIEEQKRTEHTALTNQITFIIQQAVSSIIHGLQGLAGVYTISDYYPSSAKVKSYAISRDYFSNFPGILGFGFIRRIPAKTLDSYLRAHRKLHPDFKIIDFTQHSKEFDSYVIEAIEPYATNRDAIGLNIASDTNRKATAQKAMQSGQASLTNALQLRQSQKIVPGFLFLLPIYRTVVVPNSQKEREKALIGWAFAPIEINALLKPLDPLFNSKLEFELSEVSPNGDVVLFKSPALSSKSTGELQKSTLEVAGCVWKIRSQLIESSTERLMRILLPLVFFLTSFFGMTWILWQLYRIGKAKDEDELRIQEIESWQTAVLNGSNYSIISTQCDGLITTFNKMAEKMLGYSASDLVHKKSPAYFHDVGEIVERAKQLSIELGYPVEPGFDSFTAKAKMGIPDTNEWTYIKADGKRVPVRLCVTAIRDGKNNIIGFLGVAEDISEEVEMRQTIATQKIQMLANAKMSSLGEMAGSIAHEINTPLSTIITKAELFLMKLELGNIPVEFQKSEIEKIAKTAERIGKIVKGLRTFSRQSEQDPMLSVNIHDVIQDTLELCQERFRSRSIELTCLCEEGLFVKGRSSQLSQALLNLLGNSFDAIQNDPHAWVKVSAARLNEWIELSVTDSGEGISAEVAEKIKLPFFTTKQVGAGTGLGLSIAEGIVLSHKGRLHYDSSGTNTCFKIILPAL